MNLFVRLTPLRYLYPAFCFCAKIMKISKPENIVPDRITNIIFDWGGVITNIDYHRTVDAFSQLGHKSFDSFFTQHYQDELFKRYETGSATTSEIMDEISRENRPAHKPKRILQCMVCHVTGYAIDPD